MVNIVYEAAGLSCGSCDWWQTLCSDLPRPKARALKQATRELPDSHPRYNVLHNMVVSMVQDCSVAGNLRCVEAADSMLAAASQL